VGTAAQFYYPCGVALDGAGGLYVADRDNHRIRRIDLATAQVTTVAGSTLGATDGQGTVAQFNTPWGVAVDGAGTVYVADAGNARIRKIAPGGQVTTVAGSVQGFADGTGSAARFATPWSVAVDPAGWVYVADAGSGNGDFFSIGPGNNRVRLVSPAGVVTTLAGDGGNGLVDGAGTTAQFAGPRGVAVGPTGTVYVADQQNHRVRTITGGVSGTFTYTPPAGTVLTAGAHTLSVTFTPTDTFTYSSVTLTAPLTVARATPAVTWPVPAPITFGTPLSASQLNATANVPGAFDYTPAPGTMPSAGTHILSATFAPADVVNYLPLTVTVPLTVRQLSPVITWAAPASIAFGTPLSVSQLNAIASVPGTFTYSPPAGTVLPAGTHALSASFAPADAVNYSPATATATLTVTPATRTTTWGHDYDGDGAADPAVFRPATGAWYQLRSGSGAHGLTWGAAGDLPVPADYDGDGQTDLAVFRPSQGTWYIVHSSTRTALGVPWGQSGDVPVPADYDGDGRADIAIYRPAAGTWYIVRSSVGTAALLWWGQPGDQPLPADYDGDGKADPTVFRAGTGTWFQFRSTTQSGFGVVWGQAGDVPLAADYDGDGKADPTVFRANTGTWFQRRSATGSAFGIGWGQAGDLPIVGDYDGDGTADPTVFRPGTSTWFQLRSGSGQAFGVTWGAAGDTAF
jgi:hypothetical protein